MLWEQIEKSGLLQLLPTALSRQAMHTPLVADPVADSAGLSQGTHNLLELFGALHMLLQPALLTTHAAGLQCLVPAMQLALNTVQAA
jgi:hypothetical protein